MRLIDADELKKQFVGYKYGTNAIFFWINKAPEVEAIPIEWIRDESRKAMEPNSYRDYDLIYASCMLQLLERWEKENESKKTG